MALEFTQLQAVTEDWYKKNKVEDLYFRASIMLYRLLGNGAVDVNLVDGNDTIDGGKRILEFLEYAEAQTDTYGSGTTISDTKKEILNQASYAWSGYHAANSIDLDDLVQNGDSPRAMVKLIHAKLNNIAKTIRTTMNTGLYGTRNGSTSQYGFDGLGDLFNPVTSFLYGNIAEDDMPAWKANVLTAAGSISYAVMQSIFALASVGQTEAEQPDLIVTTRTLCDAYAAKLQVQQRFVQDKKMAEAGFRHTLHDGVVMGYDEACPAGELYALNTKRLAIKTHRKYNFTDAKWIVTNELKPDSYTANSRWMGALVCSDRGAMAKAEGLTA
jgi:hypothetical protein